jgi:threonine dehydratase
MTITKTEHGLADHHRLSLQAIEQAARVIDPVFLRSPQYECEPLSEALGCKLVLKNECANPIRSFKGRGASYLLHSLHARDPNDSRLIVGSSAGNWGQALAYACRAAGRSLVLYAAVNANPMKVARMRALGADVRLQGHDFDAAKQAAEAFAAREGFLWVADGQDKEASEGAGTIGMELLERGDRFDAVLVALGNGALLTGVARWVKSVASATCVVGVSAAGADAMERSWRHGTIVTPESVNTIADGIAVRVPIPVAVQDMRGIVDDVLLVQDSHMIEAMRLLYRHAGLLVEPSGAVGVAAIVADRQRFAGRRVATILCGSNMTQEQIDTYLR